MKMLYFLIALLLSSFPTLAAERINRNKLNSCTLSKEAKNNYEPEVFQLSNNLLRTPGGSPIVCGKRIVIKGKVLDRNCVPVSDAKVYLWQVGCDGKYPYRPLRTKTNSKYINTKSGSSFQGSGTATTDNNGEFQFITLYPAKSESKSPHINFRVEHRDIGEIQTEFFPLMQDDEIYDYTIVMHKENLYRKY